VTFWHLSTRFRALINADRARLTRRLTQPSPWDAFVEVVRRAGLAAADDTAIIGSLLTVARERPAYGEVWELAERPLDHGANAALWRSRHVIMVER
jgi:tryptophan 2,3-dioxygenase